MKNALRRQHLLALFVLTLALFPACALASTTKLVVNKAEPAALATTAPLTFDREWAAYFPRETAVYFTMLRPGDPKAMGFQGSPEVFRLRLKLAAIDGG